MWSMPSMCMKEERPKALGHMTRGLAHFPKVKSKGQGGPPQAENVAALSLPLNLKWRSLSLPCVVTKGQSQV